MQWRYSVVLAGLVAVAAAPLTAADSNDMDKRGLKKITEIEGISEYRLENGMKVLLFPDSSSPRVTVNLTVFVGSRHEGYGEAGMAHLLEHMLFKGTPTHPDIPKVLQERGAQFNGTTWVDRTNYFETLPASDENLEFALRLEADRMMNSSIKEEDLASEMTVVRNEFEQGENSPAYVLSQRMLSAAYQWHNYGQATIGNRADIERVPIGKLREFYRKYYQPDNAMLIVSGRFDTEKALSQIAKYFGAIPRPERELPKTYTEEPAQDGERFVTLRRVGDLALVGTVYHIPAGPHPDYAAIAILENILTDDPSGRLYKALVESKKASSVSGAAFAWHDPGVLRIMAEVTKGNDPETVLGTMLDVIGTVEEGVTEEEVERSRQRLLRQREMAASDSRRIAIQLSEWAAQGDWRLYFLHRDRLEEVTADDVQRVAAAYLQRNNRTVGMYIPTQQSERVAIPGTPDLAELIGDYQGRDDVSVGESFDVTPANIEARTRRLTLGDGVQAAVLPKQTRGQTVNLRLALRYGDEDNLKGLVKASELLPALMIRGTKELTRQQLQDELDRYRATLNANGSAGEAVFTLETRREHLPAVLKLLRQVLREPTLPENEFETLKRERLAGLERQLTDPQALATTTVRQKINPYNDEDPRYVPTLEEEIELFNAVMRDDVKKLYDEYLGGHAGELAVVGDFDADETLPLLSEMLADWQAGQPYDRLRRLSGDVEGTAIEILTPDKDNAMYFAALTLPMRDDHDDYPAMVIGDFVLGSGSLSSRLGNRIRQQEGLAYGVGSGFQALSLDDRAAFYLYASSNPGNTERLKTAIREEFDRLLAEGITEEELQAAKRGYLQREQVSRTSDSRLASVLTNTLEADRTMQYHADLEEKIDALTAEQVTQALRKHLDPDRLVIVTAGDFKKNEKGGE